MTVVLRFWIAAIACFTLLVTSACSLSSEPEIQGIWEAEDVHLASLAIQVGPRLEISENHVVIPELNVKLQLATIEREAPNTVKLRFVSNGLIPLPGWTLYFESSDRIRMDIPLVGSVYYRRAKDSAIVHRSSSPILGASRSSNQDKGQTAAKSEPAIPKSPPISTDTAPAPTPHLPLTGSQEPVLDIVFAALQREDADGALRVLGDALQTGAISWLAVERDPRLLPLRQDVRYQALMGRYR